jgi:hypothetical protein
MRAREALYEPCNVAEKAKVMWVLEMSLGCH